MQNRNGRSRIFLAFAFAIALPVAGSVAWASPLRASTVADEEISCQATFGCTGGTLKCAEFSTTEGGWKISLTCWGPLNET